MALIPLKAKAPMVEKTALPLRAGNVRWTDGTPWLIDEALRDYMDAPCVWEGGLLLAALLHGKLEDGVLALRVRRLMREQAEDGSFALPLPDALAAARAMMALYAAESDRNTLQAVGRWLGWLGAHVPELLEAEQAGLPLADVWELLEAYYCLTGRKAVLKLCEQLRRDGLDWPGLLRTFQMQREMAANGAYAELMQAVAGGDADRAANARRLLRLGHAESLADGLRTALYSGSFSGSTTDLGAAREGFERIVRWHGAACGGVTADEWLAGRAPGKAISAGTVGAWMEALAACAAEDKGEWALEALERLAENALPQAVDERGQPRLQRVNAAGDETKQDCYALIADAAHQLGRLARGVAAAAAVCAMNTKNGVLLNWLHKGAYRVSLGGKSALLTVQRGAADDGRCLVDVQTKTAVEAAISIRVPGWAEKAELTVSGEDTQTAGPGETIVFSRVWECKTRILINMEPRLQAEDGYHQSVSVYRGPVLYSADVSGGQWRVAAAGAPEVRGDQVKLPVKPIDRWERIGDVPVRPVAPGEAAEIALQPYGGSKARIAVFPRERNA